jgi:hypothetical protein
VVFMIRIICSNPACPAPDHTFLWDERPHLGERGQLAEQGEEGAVSFMAECPYGHQTKIWLKDIKTEEVVKGLR